MSKQIRQLYQALCQTIGEEVKLYEDMIREMKNKQQSIINGDVDQMKNSVTRERVLSKSVMTHVNKRMELTHSIGESISLDDENVTLKELLNHADADMAALLKGLRYRLKSNANQIANINRDNKYLLSASIDHVRGLVNLFLKDDSKTDDRYEGTGMMADSAEENRVLDFQI